MAEKGAQPSSPDIVILGAGFSGLIIAHELKRHGYHDFQIAESADGVGGVWRENRYPGAACDAPIDIYTPSFRPSAEFSSNLAPWHEILAYMNELATSSGIMPHVRTSTKVLSAEWDQAQQRWDIRTDRGDHWTPRFFIWAGGRLHQPLIPEIPGRDRFQGEVVHSTQWNEDVEVRGRRIAMVGASATAIQMLPHLASGASHLFALMRTPPYVFSKKNVERLYDEAERAARRNDPELIKASRDKLELFLDEHARTRFPMNDEAVKKQTAEWRRFFEAEITDPELRHKLAPDYIVGCRRFSFSDTFYASLAQPHVTVARTGLAAFTSTGVRTQDGQEFDVDLVALATGFRADGMLGDLTVRGRDGVELADQWRDGQAGYLGVVVKNFPNLFLVDGPSAELASATISMEIHARFIISCLDHLAQSGGASLEVRADVQDSFNVEVDAALNKSALILGGCQSWHRVGGNGKVFTHWPGTPNDMRDRVGVIAPEEFIEEAPLHADAQPKESVQ